MIHELEKLKRMLHTKGIDWDNCSDGDIQRIRFKTSPRKIWSAINGLGTFGGYYPTRGVNHGLIELWDFTKKNDPVGWLTAEDVMRIVFGEEGNG